MTTQTLTLLCCLWWLSVVPTPNTEAGRKLQYLIEPPHQVEVTAHRGEAVVLPCILRLSPAYYNIKWTKQEGAPVGLENIVMIANARSFKPYGQFRTRASPRRAHVMDASLVLSELQLDDGGLYRCELIYGIMDESVTVTLTITGVVFPYQGQKGRYSLTFQEAATACAEQDGVLASYQQLYQAWTEGLDWCNAGWTHNGSVHYPILQPRPGCGDEPVPGIRSYGPKDKQRDHYDAFCFTSAIPGSVFFAPGSFSFQQAEPACLHLGAQLALVGQLYSAWRFQNLDQCDGGWLRDGSVRYPIRRPRKRCGGVPGAGVRSFGFPDQKKHLYGAYCYRP
ncbi:hyaluronan and proteoglycan link protein 2 [Synchiropus picturatus]